MTDTHPTLRAVLWDMDGTLLDTEEHHWRSWQDILAGEGIVPTRDHFLATFGRRTDDTLRDLLGDRYAAADVVRIANAKEERFRELVRVNGASLLPGVHPWLLRLQQAGWRQAVASSAPPANISAILAALDLATFFGATVSAADVTIGKPDPQVFLVAADRLGVPPARCIVVEDAAAGVEAAHRAGMRAIAVGPRFAALGGDLAVRSLAELPVDAFERFVPGRGGRP